MPVVEAQSVSLDLRPLSPAIGAEVIGANLSQGATDALFDAIRQAFLRYQLLLFRDQCLSEEWQIAFTACFGEVHINPSGVMSGDRTAGRPEIYRLTNLDENGAPTGEHPDRGTMVWHTDGSWLRIPGLATVLYGEEVPAQGGDTLFANMYLAYDALDEDEKSRLQGWRAVHDLDYTRRRAGAKVLPTAAEKDAAPPVDHPVVRTHPETGRQCIYLGEHASHIASMTVADGYAEVLKINKHATQEQFIYRHRWRKRDLVVWDNRCTLHCATDFDLAHERRIVRRTSAKCADPVV